MEGARSQPRLRFRPQGPERGDRLLPDEVAVALSFNGSTQAVMMATPDDLVDFATGFALTEGIARPSEIDSIEVVSAGRGLDVQVWLKPQAQVRLATRRRTMTGPIGCGLCGIDSIEQALRDLDPVVRSGFHMTPQQVHQAVDALAGVQRLRGRSGAVHCAAFWTAGAVVAAREDVGRHNALDKLAGALVRASGSGIEAQGAVVLTSRVSIDLVQKVAALGAGVLIALSTPTASAVDLAEQLGITLICNTRQDGFDLYSHSDRLTTEALDVR
ncbi:MAG: formate dehydrogenase accessory sulfurtransferase FdhD [Gemmobacter sp.]|nr:formate dehydrogenase accessory sulfurtransferase FdhD [Gemmobacter sp.]